MKLLEPGAELDGFTVEECIHSGGMAHIYRVRYTEGARDPGFPLAMKIPRMTAGDGAENIVSFEVEHQIMQALSGVHVPRFVAAGDLERVPYLVMEYVHGRTLEHWLELAPQSAVRTIAGAAVVGDVALAPRLAGAANQRRLAVGQCPRRRSAALAQQ